MLPEDWARMDRVVDRLMDDLTNRGVAWGRIPISKWTSGGRAGAMRTSAIFTNTSL